MGKAIILLLSSPGMRIDLFPLLRVKDLIPIEKYSLYQINAYGIYVDKEYDLKYLGVIGNLFSQKAIDWSLIDKELEAFEYSPKSMGIDTGFEFSALVFVLLSSSTGR